MKRKKRCSGDIAVVGNNRAELEVNVRPVKSFIRFCNESTGGPSCAPPVEDYCSMEIVQISHNRWKVIICWVTINLRLLKWNIVGFNK